MSIENQKVHCKIIVIDTTSFTGNYERELCAYLTGQVGDCGVGSELAELAEEGMKHLDWWNNNICPQESEDGSEFYRPCSIWPTEGISYLGEPVKPGERIAPGYFSVAIFVEEFPPEEVLQEMLERLKVFSKNPEQLYIDNGFHKKLDSQELTITGYRLIEPKVEKVLVEVDKVTSNNIRKFKI